MPIKLINPMNEAPVRVSMPPARPRSLEGKTVGLLDISKTGGNLFLDRLERLLRERFHVANVVRTT
ncbi:MAG: UGSC family (seleno)protein, partial [Candidatus Acidiferrales bacterium]